MTDVSLAQFQFDYDLTWAAFFMNPDGTIYGRYGTRSVAGPMAHISIASLKNAMRRALLLHRDYPTNGASLAGKRGSEPRWKTALAIPALRRRFAKKLMAPKKGCIHCHHIYDGWHETAYDEGAFDIESIWVYPLPSNIGMPIDVDSGNVISKVKKGSFAQKAGVKDGDTIRTMNGQPIISIADMQWVLHNQKKAADLHVEVERNGEVLAKTLKLSGDWKRSDISWRESIWGLPPKLGIRTHKLKEEERERLGLAPDALALKVLGPPRKDVQKARVKKGDIIVEANGKTEAMTQRQFNVWVKLNYHPGDQLPIRVIREGKKISLTILLE